MFLMYLEESFQSAKGFRMKKKELKNDKEEENERVNTYLWWVGHKFGYNM